MSTSQATASVDAATADVENDGIPVVNRKRNNIITKLGFLVFGAIGLFALVAVNSPRSEAQPDKKERPDKIASTLPALPATAFSPPKPPPPPPPAPSKENLAPVPKGGKAPPSWWDRKMAGDLTAGRGLSTGSSSVPSGPASRYRAGGSLPGTSPAERALAAAQTRQAQLRGGGGSGGSFGGAGGLGGEDSLNVRLQPTITKVAQASILPDRRFLITKGMTLDCVMDTAISSQLAGIVRCHLTRDMYSDNGQVVLLDRGSTLVGEYKSGIKQGDTRIFVLWTRAETPNGVVIALESPGIDTLGRTGHEGFVDNHFWERFGAAIMVSLIDDTVSAIASRNGRGTTNYYGDVADDGSEIIKHILDSTANIPATLVKNQGEHIQIMVARDLDFSTTYDLALVPDDEQ
jgi:type IV secretion system protein VirB10